jgi:hypothetical protein
VIGFTECVTTRSSVMPSPVAYAHRNGFNATFHISLNIPLHSPKLGHEGHISSGFYHRSICNQQL